MRGVGTSARGLRLPVIEQGVDLVPMIVEAVKNASAGDRDGFEYHDGDIVAVTESLVARSQGNYVSEQVMADDIADQLNDGDVVLLYPILSRNRFLAILKALAKATKGTLHILLSYPSDEVGNAVMDLSDFYCKAGTLPTEGFDEQTYRQAFGDYRHPFTGIDYVELYKSVAPEKIKIWFSQSPLFACKLARQCVVASIHLRHIHRQLLEAQGMKVVTLDQVCSRPSTEHGYNPEYGLLGSNFAREGLIKLFPRDCQAFVDRLSAALQALTGKKIECLIYGDGAFKDPVGGIWELADPVVSPAQTDRLKGLPREIKLKYVADNRGELSAAEAVERAIKEKASKEVGQLELGTTPRRYSDLVGSLCDLVSGSGDKGTPVIYISGYFDNYLDD